MSSILMVIPDAFHLGWMGATRRLLHIADAFRSMGFEVVLMAGAMTDPSLQIEVDRSFPGQVIRLGHTGDYPFLIDQSALLRRAWRAVWKLRGDTCYWSKLSWGWADRMDMDCRLEKLHLSGHAPVLVWGVGVGYLEGGVAAHNIARELGLPWILELQDPPRRAGLGPDNHTVKKCFSALLNDADRIIVTAASYGDSLQREYRLGVGKLRTIHLSYEGHSLGGDTATIKGDVFTIAYAGSLNGGRSLRPLLVALAATFEEHPEIRPSFKLELAGGGPGFDEVDQQASAMGLAENIEAHGLVTGNKVAEILERAAVVVVIQESTSALQVPGKIFEILKAGKPVIGLMPRECEAATILVQAGLGFIHEKNDVEGLRETVIHLWQAWRENKAIAQPNKSFIGEFSTERLPVKLAVALNGIVHIPNFPHDTKAKHKREIESMV